MSEQKNEPGGTTTLEEVFLSREFERSLRGAASGPEKASDVTGPRRVIITGAFESALRVPDPVLYSGSDEAASDKELEDVLLSAQFGQPLRLVPPLGTVSAAPAAERVVVPFPALPPRDNRYRAIAAVSGIAAAVLVVAGVSTGTGQPRSGDVAALGQRPAAQSRGGLSSPRGAPTGAVAPGAGASDAALASSNGSGPVAPVVQNATPQSTNAPGSASAVSGSPVTKSSAPSPGVPAGGPTGSGGGTGVGTGSPALTPPAGADPVAPVVTGLESSVTGVGTSITSAAGQLGTSIPATTTAAAALGTGGGTVSEIGQALSSTTA